MVISVLNAGKKVSVSTRQARCSCGGLWKLDFTPPPFRPDGIDKSQWSQFRYRKYMALEDESWRELTLGEGMTPWSAWTGTFF